MPISFSRSIPISLALLFVAGVGQMQYRRFLLYNILGGVGWVLGMTWAGYLLGRAIPNVDRYMHIIVIIVIILSVIPIGVEILKERRRRVV